MSEEHSAAADLFAGNSEMAMRMRSHDWSQTPLGAVETWSSSLCMMVRFLLVNRFPLILWWGPHYIQFYNDPYSPIPGTKHPKSMGQPASECWSEIWHVIGPLIDRPFQGGLATWMEDILLEVNRHGFVEETHFTIAYSPVPDETAPRGIGGVLGTVHEITQKVIGERRVMILRDLGAHVGEAKTAEEACAIAAETLAKHAQDVPFALIYLVDSDSKHAHLSGVAGTHMGEQISPRIVNLHEDAHQGGWPLDRAMQTETMQVLEDLGSRFPQVPPGPWSDPPHTAVVLPIPSNKAHQFSGLLVVGLSSRLRLDQPYCSFLELMTTQIATAIANAQAYEEECKRAEALAEVDRAKTVFFSNISHEFRTPLTLMLSPLEELSNTLDERLQPDEREQLQLVQCNGLRLQKLVNTLLDFSRIEAGRVQASYEPTDLATYTAELASVFRSLIERAGMNLVIDCSPLAQPVYVDLDMWEKIVLNLISNAFKFTFTGSIIVRLQPIGHFVELSVTDTGVGIPEAELPRLFERFHRVSGMRARTYEGSGIGLALVQELVKLHGGTIRVTSQVDCGTTFAIVLPFGSAHLPQDRIKATRTLASTALGANPYIAEASRWLPEESGRVDEWMSSGVDKHPSTHSSPAHILLADDNADMRDYMKRLLRQYWEVETVSDGLAALKSIAERLPDLVLSDVMMPGLDGFGLLREVRANPRTKEIPMILLSARAGEESRIEGLQAGADDYLIKPFSARELLARVESNLKLAQLRREASAVLRESQEKLSLFIEHAPAAMAMFDRQMRYLAHSQRWLKDYELTENIIGRSHYEVFPDLPESWKQIHQNCLAGAVEKSDEDRFVRDNSVNWLKWEIRPWFNAAGEIGGIVIFSENITDRKQAEAALLESEERFRNMADNAPVMVWVTDPMGYCTYLSQGWYDFTGQTQETGLGFGWLNRTHPDDRQMAERLFLDANQRQKAFKLEYRLQSKDGKYIWVIDAASPWFGLDGQFKGYIGSVIDISERKQTEQEQEQLLQREQEARETAEQANRIKDEFLAVLSHELRSPLNAILGWAKLLRNGKLDATRTTYALETIERNAQLQSQLIEDLLDIARILRGKLSLNPSLVDLSIVISSALQTVRLAAEAKSLQIQTVFSPSQVAVLGDARRLQQVVCNLLSNAVKFTPASGQITIALTHTETDAQIQVLDTGKGINPDFLPYVFEHFRQEDGATTRKFGGLGLGLAIARQIVELHGGTVAVDSPGEGQGATFTVQLPLVSVSSQPLSRAVNSVSMDDDLSDIHILVVDDKPDSREFVAFVLEQAGASVTNVTSGIEALQAIGQSVPDLIISDIGMPEMDGYMLMRQIRAHKLGRQIPAIALTAYAGELDQQLARASGFQRHLAKPVEPTEIIAVVAHLCRQKGQIQR